MAMDVMTVPHRRETIDARSTPKNCGRANAELNRV
jgi:hypothetical protein